MTTRSSPPRPTGILDRIPDTWAYILPMAIFLGFTQIGSSWPQWFTHSYVIKTFGAALALALLWRHYTRIRWNHWWLGVIVGVIGIVQWVGMEKLILAWWPDYPRMGDGEVFNPYEKFSSPAMMWTWIAIRWAGASLVVPVMEELFWRDFLWRSILAPNDFKLAAVGEWDWKAFVIVALVFGAGVHVQWMTAIVWGLMIGWLLLSTKSIGACIIAHGVTNFLLGLYVLIYKDWAFW